MKKWKNNEITVINDLISKINRFFLLQFNIAFLN